MRRSAGRSLRPGSSRGADWRATRRSSRSSTRCTPPPSTRPRRPPRWSGCTSSRRSHGARPARSARSSPPPSTTWARAWSGPSSRRWTASPTCSPRRSSSSRSGTSGSSGKIGKTTHRSGLPAKYRGGRFEPAAESAARVEMRAPASEAYLHEMPGGQFTNLREQARALGLAAGTRWRAPTPRSTGCSATS